jgi:O-antigen biosynthesis protein
MSDNFFNPLDYPICFSQPLLLDNISAWTEHIPFGMVIVELLCPKILVELGTHSGVSYSSFCQAVKTLKLDTHCFAVDTWLGDEQAGFYTDQILTDLRGFHDANYSGFSKLLQSTFDDAATYFNKGSIDLLHIDGLHTYNAVKHDFETWLPKMSQSGVVLFHDISEKEKDFGVWKLWEELKVDYPNFEFFHGHGLGILAVGPKYSSKLDLVIKAKNETQRIRDYFYLLGNRLQKEQQICNDNQFIRSLTNQLAERDQSVQTLNNCISEQQKELFIKENNIIQLEEEVLSYALSKSWRYTRFLRKIRRNFMKRK